MNEYHVTMTETFTVTYLVEAEDEKQAEKRVRWSCYEEELSNSREEMQLLKIEELTE